MAKAILVMDMPKNCVRCKLKSTVRGIQNVIACCNLVEGMIALEGGFEKRLDGCPLREVPQKKEVSFNHWDRAVFANGYNACIDDILGKKRKGENMSKFYKNMPDDFKQAVEVIKEYCQNEDCTENCAECPNPLGVIRCGDMPKEEITCNEANLQEAARPLVEYLQTHYHPHCAAIVDQIHAEIMEGKEVAKYEPLD